MILLSTLPSSSSPSSSCFSSSATTTLFSSKQSSPSSSHFFRVSTSKLCFIPSSSSPVAFRSLTAAARRSTSSCALSSPPLHANAMAELLNDKQQQQQQQQASNPSSSSAAADDDENKLANKQIHSRTFLHATTEQELLLGIRKEAEAGRLPPNVAAGMEELYQNYRNAVLQSGVPGANEIVLSNMAVALNRILLDVEDPFVFSPHHKALREPFDYYTFGQNYIRPLIDFRNSYVGNISLFKEMEEKLQRGHNVVLISNHQSEADPAIIGLLLETTNPHIAENLIYVAGDRVITDPLCKPFSMGRNLICVYSKKHMYDVPELAETKKRANIRSLKEMAVLLRNGSKIVWIAPSGGRDRPDPVTGDWYPAPFDASSLDNMRRLAEHSGSTGHIYPLALLCHDIMPPPPQVEREIGEKRVISFYGAGLSVAPEISFSEITAACENPEEAKDVYTQALYNSVAEQYSLLKSAIHGKQGLEASIPTITLSQPWN